MNQGARDGLQQVLQITLEMLDAAASSNWDRVAQLDRERCRLLHAPRTGALSEQERQIVSSLRKHNQTLMAHMDVARATLKQNIDRHQYNHRALRTYISSSASL